MATRGLGTLTLDLVTRIGGFVRPMDEAERRARRNFGRMRREAKDTSSAISASLRTIAAAFAGVFSAREIYQSAEQWTTMNNRLRLVTDSSMALVAAQEDVFAIAQRSRQPLAATAELYQRIATNAKDLNLSATELSAVVETINKTLVVSGTTGQAASAALVQLGQAFASGELRGEELNSVLEQAPGLAKAIADGMGVAVGELRALAKEGNLTANTVIDAILNQANVVDEQFGKIQKTIGQSLPVLGNSFTRIIGEIDGVTGATAGLAEGLIDLSEYLDSGEFTAGFLQSMTVWGATFDAFKADIGSAGLEFDGLKFAASESAGFIGQAFMEMPANLRAAIQIATVEILALFDRVVAYTKWAKEIHVAVWTTPLPDLFGELQKNQERLSQAIGEVNDRRQQGLVDIVNERDQILKLSADERQRYIEEKARRDQERKDRQTLIEQLKKDAESVQAVVGGAGGELVKAFDKQLQSYNRLLNKEKELTELQKLRYEFEDGKLKGISADQLKQLEVIANQIDKERELENVNKALANAYQDIYTETQKITNAHKERADAIKSALDAAIIGETEYQDLLARNSQLMNTQLADIARKNTEIENAYTRAAERIDSTFSSAWQNIDGGFTDLRDGIVGGFKSMLAEMAHEAITRPIVLQIQQSVSGAAAGLGGSGSGGANAAAGMLGAGGIYGAVALAAIAAVNIWNKEQDEKFVKMTAEYRQGTQSLGTILGEQNRKSESIANLTDLLSRTAQDTLDVNYGMYRTLLDIRTGISGVASGFAKTLTGQNALDIATGTSTFNYGAGSLFGGKENRSFVGFFDPSGIFGDDFGDMVTGFFGTIANEINKAIYNKKTKIIDSGIGFVGQTLADIMEEGLVDAFAYADVNTRKKILGITASNRTRRETEALNDILLGQFADVFGSAGNALEQAADIFGLDFEKYINRLIVPAQSLSLKDLEGDALTQEIESFFSSTLDNWAGVLVNGTMVLEQFQQIGEGAFETVMRLAAETASFTHYAERLGLSFDLAGMSAVNAVQDLVELSGGMDALTSSLSTYADRFFTDSEKIIQVQQSLSGAFGELGLALPASREQFRALVEGINLATAAGRDQFSALMSLTGATDSYLTALEREQKAREDALRTAVGSAFDVFNRALEEQKRSLESVTGITIEALQADIDRVAQSLSAHQQVASTLTSTLRSMKIESAQVELLTRRAAQAQLVTANAIARAGGPLPVAGQLDDALRTLAEPSQNLFATFEDYARDFYTTARNIKDLQEATGNAVTIDEKNLQALQDQLQQAQDFHDEQIAQLERLGAYYQDQINVLNGIDTSVLSVAEAINRLSQALGNAGFTPSTPAPEIPILSNEYQNQKTAQTLAIGNEKQSPRKRPGGAVDVTEEEEDDLVTLVKQLIEDLGVSQLAIAKNTQKTSKVLERWDIDGLPEERV